MKIACICWFTNSVGGIATHLNAWRCAAIKNGDQFDILHSNNWSRKVPTIFPDRVWVRGGDTRIWVDGEIPQNKKARRWLESNYDAVIFGFICPHKTASYKTQDFLYLYDTKLPKVSCIMDGHWSDYSEWATPLLDLVNGVVCPLASYALPIRDLTDNIVISPFPFNPSIGKRAHRSKKPLLVWPNQLKEIKGFQYFLPIVPDLSPIRVEIYSNGILYYRWRSPAKKDRYRKRFEKMHNAWISAIGTDKVDGYNGNGKADFYGNVSHATIVTALQKAWYTVNLQGITSSKDTYRSGSYNNTEVEALYYGACPILHTSTEKTDLPTEIYLRVGSGGEIPGLAKESFGFALDEGRQRRAKEFVLDNHLASKRYQEVRELLL